MYDNLFSVRVDKFLEKLTVWKRLTARKKIFPDEFHAIMDMLRNRLNAAKAKSGKSTFPPATSSSILETSTKSSTFPVGLFCFLHLITAVAR